jgi:DNA-binding NarL/FixJ family response regulator
MIQVVIVDDEPLLRVGIRSILEAHPDIRVPADCDGPEAAEAVRRHRPDVVLLDLWMPRYDGLTVLAELRALQPPPTVAMLSTFSADENIATALRAGASGFLLKDTAPRDLAHAVRLLASGGTAFSPGVAGAVIDGYLNHARPEPATALEERLGRLTAREREVLTLLADGLSNTEIGARILLSPATVKDHVSVVLRKLELANRVQAAVFAHAAGLVQPQSAPGNGPGNGPGKRSGEPG